jgi:hypothetical protein
MEMIIGQLFLVTAIGKIVTVWRPTGRLAERRAAGQETDPPAASASSNESDVDGRT